MATTWARLKKRALLLWGKTTGQFPRIFEQFLQSAPARGVICCNMKASESNGSKERSAPLPSTGTARRDQAPIDGVMNETTLEKLIQRSEAVTETLKHILYFTLPPPPKVRK